MNYFRKHLIAPLLCTSFFFIACQEEPEATATPTEAYIEIEGSSPSEEVTLVQEGSLKLTAICKGGNHFEILWEVNNKEVSRETTYEFVATEVGQQLLTLTTTNEDGSRSKANLAITVYGKYKHGTIVLNEGNMTSENGFITFISPQGVITDSAYYKVNNSSLGNTAQDLFITNQKMYIISQNGGGDGTLVVANAETLIKEAGYSPSLSWPSHVAVVGSNQIYIRDNKGIHLFNPETNELTFVEGTKGAAKNRMAVIDKKVFVPAGNKIYVIEGEQVETVQFAGQISGVIATSDKNLYVSCTTTPAQINKMNSKDYSIIQTNVLGDVKVGAGYGATPGISAKGDTIYLSNASTKIYRHLFKSNQTEFMVDVKEQIEQAGIVYNNLAVHPITGEVYFNTLKGFGANYLVNNISVWNFSKEEATLQADYKNHTHFPAGIFFTYNF